MLPGPTGQPPRLPPPLTTHCESEVQRGGGLCIQSEEAAAACHHRSKAD
jgi:hypothetical protein